MTPQEKAKDLVNKYFKQSDLLYEDLTWIQAKECAKIAVEHILNSDPNNLHSEYDYNECKLGVDVEYWQEVKNEIEKL